MSETVSTDEVRFAATSRSLWDDSVTETEFADWLNSVKAEAFEEGWADHYVFPGSKRNPYRAKEEA